MKTMSMSERTKYIAVAIALCLMSCIVLYAGAVPHGIRSTDNNKNQEDLGLEDSAFRELVKDGCLNAGGPVPYILMSRGRSGSGSTWQIIGNLTGMETPSNEYTGASADASQEFFDLIGGEDGGLWMLRNLCRKQRLYPESGVVGFKWKPFANTIHSPGAYSGLERIARSAKPAIKVVRNQRNVLDVEISRVKHNRTGVPAHCMTGDVECLQKHKDMDSTLHLPTERLVDILQEMTREEDDVSALLLEMKVPHVNVSYEKLYHDEDAEEWMRIFRFLGVGPAKHLTRQGVQKAMAHVDTSIQSHEDTLSNFDTVREVLKGTQFEDLLRTKNPARSDTLDDDDYEFDTERSRTRVDEESNL